MPTFSRPKAHAAACTLAVMGGLTVAVFIGITALLHHVVVQQAAFTDAARVLRPGGVLLGRDLTGTRDSRLIHLVDRSSPFSRSAG